VSKLRWFGESSSTGAPGRLGAPATQLADAFNNGMVALLNAMRSYQQLSHADQQVATGHTYPGVGRMADVIRDALARDLDLAHTHENQVQVFRTNPFWLRFLPQERSMFAEALAFVMNTANTMAKGPFYGDQASALTSFFNGLVQRLPQPEHKVKNFQLSPCAAGQVRNAAGVCAPRPVYRFAPAVSRRVAGTPSSLGGLPEAWDIDMHALVQAMPSYQRLSPADKQKALGSVYPGINWMANKVIGVAIRTGLDLAHTHQNMANVFSTAPPWTSFNETERLSLLQGLAYVMASANDERGNVTSEGIQSIDNAFRWNMNKLIQKYPTYAPVTVKSFTPPQAPVRVKSFMTQPPPQAPVVVKSFMTQPPPPPPAPRHPVYAFTPARRA